MYVSKWMLSSSKANLKQMLEVNAVTGRPLQSYVNMQNDANDYDYVRAEEVFLLTTSLSCPTFYHEPTGKKKLLVGYGPEDPDPRRFTKKYWRKMRRITRVVHRQLADSTILDTALADAKARRFG